ncbi:MAG: Ig-like domain repeat protein, partial [Ruminococcus sp.]|nr:Ig-like domain repeat protein [Ruminococcus sp.]
VYEGTERQVSSSDIKFYKFDNEKPNEFSLKLERNMWNFVLKNADKISDNYSGIKDIRYSAEYHNFTTEEDVLKLANSVGNGENFEIYLNDEMKGKQITVYVVDNAGNVRSAKIDKKNTSNIDVPKLTSATIVSFAYDTKYNDNENDDELIEIFHNKPLSYGDDRINECPATNYFYSSDNSYLKVEAVDGDMKLINLAVTVAEDVTYNVTFDVDNIAVPRLKENEENVYYIPVHDIVAEIRKQLTELPDNKVNTETTFLIEKIVVSVQDEHNEKNDENENKELINILHDCTDNTTDCQYSIELSKNTKTDVNEPDENETVYAYFYGTEPDSNYIDITLSDEDCGLASYEINLYDANGERIIAQAVTGLEEGIEKTTTLKYTTAVTNPETGEVSEHTTSEDVTYISPVKQAEAERIVFTEDGDYYLEVIVTDIDGNRTAIKRKYVVDTTAPSIESLNYEIESGILNYLTFGIYGNQNISLSLKINDGQYGTGVESKNVVLYWGGHEYKSEQNNDGKYVFNLEVNDPLPDTSLVPYIIVTDRIGHESKYYFTTIENATNIPAVPEEKLVIDDGLIDEKNGVILVLESEAPTFTITPTGKAVRTDLGNSGKELYFGRSDETESNMLNFTFEDNEGLGSFDIKLYDSEGKECQDMNVAYDFMEKEKLDERTINIDKLDTGRYKISVDLKDVAGNTQSIPADCQFNYSDFYVDKTAPTIIDTQYEVVSSILKYLSFGIFGKETITISVKVEDNQYGSGVESVELMWGDDKKHCYTSEEKDGVYTFKSLEPEYEAIPRIVVKDKLGNEETYYFTTNKQAEDNNNKGIGELIIDDTSENHISLALEKNKPDVNINVPENYDEYIVAGETWYGTPIEYIVSASDVTAESNVISGINRIEIEEDDSREVNSRKEQKFVSENGEEYVFEEKLFRDTATYTYPIEKDGHYKITANAYDNAENSNSTEKNFSIDVENPKIIRFHFGDFVNDEPFFERDYGYFFMEKTAVRIYVEDLGTSSGFCEVHLYLQGVSGEEEIHHILSGSQLLIDEITGEKYALFAEEYAIPMGFKGNVYAEVIDNVRHTSEKISADGNIIENNDIHKDVSGIDITENTPSYRTDANNNMLYNSNIPLTISVNDNFSGISTIEWSIAGDNESGTITVDIDGNIINNSEAAFVLEDSVVMEKNLVTALKFGITVDNNINGNFVNVTLTDRSGNISSNQKIYSIDMTEPTISAVMSNTTPSNSTYYNTTQDITIYITERNFNPNDVKVLLNETEQPVTWNQNGDTEKSDTTVYTGNFSITNDGKYTFSVEYADMAGNIGNTFIQPGFTIDTTAPQVVNNFEDFGKIGDEYIYYNLKQRDNAKAIISVKEANFNELDMNVNVSYKDPGNSHTDSDWKTYKYTAKWKQEGDMNTLVIPFTEDNVYKIQMSPKDRAGNPANFEVDGKKYPDQTAVFEADYTVPVITERSGKGVKEDDVSFIDFYDFERRSEESPSITFQDTNIERIDYYIR